MWRCGKYNSREFSFSGVVLLLKKGKKKKTKIKMMMCNNINKASEMKPKIKIKEFINFSSLLSEKGRKISKSVSIYSMLDPGYALLLFDHFGLFALHGARHQRKRVEYK